MHFNKLECYTYFYKYLTIPKLCLTRYLDVRFRLIPRCIYIRDIHEKSEQETMK